MPLATSSQHPIRTQASCCYRSVISEGATWCEECGKPLIRCMAFEECSGLLNDTGLCTVCVAPHLQMDAGALTAVQVGGSVALPLTLTNNSTIERPLFITNIWSREGKTDWRELALGWERLEQGKTRSTTVTADQIEQAGAHNIQILIALASRWRWRQECYAFLAQISLQIGADKASAAPVVNIGGQSAGHGNTVYITGQTEKIDAPRRLAEASELNLARAEKEERRLGLRGLDAKNWIPRRAQFKWKGFASSDVPANSPILTSDGILAFGRSRAERGNEQGDVRILVEASNGQANEELSRLLSRRHFEIYIECDRLVLRVNGSGGLRVNGEAFGSGKTIVLKDGDVIHPLVKVPDALALKVEFQTEHGRASSITFSRIPASQAGAIST